MHMPGTACHVAQAHSLSAAMSAAFSVAAGASARIVPAGVGISCWRVVAMVVSAELEMGGCVDDIVMRDAEADPMQYSSAHRQVSRYDAPRLPLLTSCSLTSTSWGERHAEHS